MVKASSSELGLSWHEFCSIITPTGENRLRKNIRVRQIFIVPVVAFLWSSTASASEQPKAPPDEVCKKDAAQVGHGAKEEGSYDPRAIVKQYGAGYRSEPFSTDGIQDRNAPFEFDQFMFREITLHADQLRLDNPELLAAAEKSIESGEIHPVVDTLEINDIDYQEKNGRLGWSVDLTINGGRFYRQAVRVSEGEVKKLIQNFPIYVKLNKEKP
jgi:hypothetical protein